MYKIDILLKQEQRLFHTRDLALLWGINNANTLYTAIKRYVKKEVLIPIHKGFYSTIPLNKIDPLELGLSSLHGFGYVSCEYILSLAGVIFQSQNYITLVSSVSKKFALAGHHFLVRRLKPAYLFNDAGLYTATGVTKASTERAVADLLYFNPSYHFDNKLPVNWAKMAQTQKAVGYL